MVNPVVIGGSGAAMLLFWIYFGWFGFPKVLDFAIKKQVALVPGSKIRGMYEKLPFPITFKIYVFNVTNAQAVANGETPIVNEVGPYVYDEYKDKINTSDNETDDSMTYDMRPSWFFNQEQSGTLTGDEMVTVPNLVIVSAILTVVRSKPGMISVVKKALDAIYKNPETIFTTVKVKDLLFDGMDIDCSSTEFASKAFCTVLKTDAQGLQIVNDTLFRMSVFGGKNGTITNKFKVKRGKKNPKEVGLMLELDKQKKIDVWDGECNTFKGTDSTIFPPFLDAEEGLMAFSADICRSLPATYVKDLVYKKVPVRMYDGDLGDPSNDPALKCFCPNPQRCPKQGAFDLYACLGAPLTATLPHMYLAHPSYQNSVIGLSPDSSKHQIIVYFEPRTGTPLYAKKRLQFNFPLEKVPKVPIMANVPECLLPLLWVEEGVELGQDLVDQVRMLFKAMAFMSVFRWLMVMTGLGMMGYGGFMFYKNSNNKFPVSPTTTASAAENKKGSGIGHVMEMGY